MALDSYGRSAAQALREVVDEASDEITFHATPVDQRTLREGANGDGQETEEVANNQGQDQQEQRKQQKQQARLEQRKRRIAERQRTLNMAKDAALQRRAKKAGQLAATVASGPGATSAAGYRATTEHLMKTRMSGRLYRARKAANTVPAGLHRLDRHESAKAEALCSRAREKMSAKDYDGAVVLLDEALRMRPVDREIQSLREEAAREALTVKMEMLLQHSRFEEAAKAARAVLQRAPSDTKVEEWFQRAVSGLWLQAKEAGEKLDKKERLKASTKMKQQRQQKFSRFDPVGTIEGHTHVGCNYAVLLDHQFHEAKRACEVLQRQSDRAHASLRNVMVPPVACDDDDRVALRMAEISIILQEALAKEHLEAKQAVANAVAAVEFSDSDEAKSLVNNAIELKRKAHEALCNAAGELAAPETGQRKPKDYKQELEAAFTHAAKNVVDTKMAAEERMMAAKIDRDIAQRRLNRIQMLMVRA